MMGLIEILLKELQWIDSNMGLKEWLIDDWTCFIKRLTMSV